MTLDQLADLLFIIASVIGIMLLLYIVVWLIDNKDLIKKILLNLEALGEKEETK